MFLSTCPVIEFPGCPNTPSVDTFLGGKIGADAVNPSDVGRYGGPESGTGAEGAF